MPHAHSSVRLVIWPRPALLLKTFFPPAITEYTNDPSYSQQAKPRATGPKVIKALTDAEMALQVCAGFREGPVTGNTCLKTTCKRQHIVATTNCTHPVYLKYGRCPDYFTKCHNTHPFPDTARKAYGSPQKGWNALKRDIADKKVAFAITDIDPANEVTGPRSGRGTTRPERGLSWWQQTPKLPWRSSWSRFLKKRLQQR